VIEITQVSNANLSISSLKPLWNVLDSIPVVPLELAVLGNDSSTPFGSTRDLLESMIADARMTVVNSAAKLALPAMMFGVDTLDLLAAVFLYTMEGPYPLYSFITVPLNVSDTRTLQSILQQLPYMKLFSLGLRCLPKDYHFRFNLDSYCYISFHLFYRGTLYRVIDVKKNESFKVANP
jgi:hypothetical protein